MGVFQNEEIDIKNINPDVLVDITAVQIDESLTGEERRKEFVRQVRNPYCYKVGDIIVVSRYTEGISMSERFQELIMSL